MEGQRCGISAIVFWEIAKLSSRGRISTGLHDPHLIEVLATLHVWPIDLPVCRMLAELDFSSDPVDEIIAATSLAHDVPLLTRDRTIRRSKIVPLAK
jgi:PIN domain nuclease of toxin-antitoxin system